MRRWTPLFLALAALPASADDWPHWRGPRRDGISTETEWRSTWSPEGPRVLWKADVGTGYSAFAVAGGRVCTLGNDDNTDTVFCFDAETGKTLWTHTYPSELGDRFFDGGPVSTPAFDGPSVYVLGKWGDLFCLEAASGKVIWSTNVAKSAGVRLPGWGFSGSPVVHGKLLLLNIGHGGAAVEKDSGKIVWKSADKDSGYSTPLVIRKGDASLALMGSGNSWYAVETASGREAWRVRWVTSYGVNAADPIVEGGRVFLSSGYAHGGALLKLGEGEPEPVWENKTMACQMNPCVLINGHLYGVSGDTDKKPALKCIEFATGIEKWSQDGLGAGGVAAAAGKLLVLAEHGELIVAPATPEGFKPSARANVLGGKSWTVPVLANGRIYARNSAGDVVCLDVRK